MEDVRQSELGNACMDAYQRLLHETLAFTAARLYLLQINVAASQGVTPIKEAHDAFVAKLQPQYETPYRYFIERSFISLVASFELFLQDIVTTIVAAYPKKIGQIGFKLAEILDAADSDELVRRGIEDTFNKLMYKKPMEYLGEITSLLSIDEAPLLLRWPIFVEAKARRDLGVHNGWRCNAIYIRKLTEVGLTPTIAQGDSAFPHDNKYLEAVEETFDDLATLIIEAVIAKYLR
jgi:hypothetical protein